jgi:hypothetical protein
MVIRVVEGGRERERDHPNDVLEKISCARRSKEWVIFVEKAG